MALSLAVILKMERSVLGSIWQTNINLVSYWPWIWHIGEYEYSFKVYLYLHISRSSLSFFNDHYLFMFIFVHLVFLLLQSPQMITFWSAKVCVCVDSKFVCVLHTAPLQLGNPSAGSVSSRERLFGFRQVQNCHLHMYQQSQRRESYPARALRALGLLLADGAPTVGWGKTFWRVGRVPLTKTDVTRKRKIAQ